MSKVSKLNEKSYVEEFVMKLGRERKGRERKGRERKGGMGSSSSVARSSHSSSSR